MTGLLYDYKSKPHNKKNSRPDGLFHIFFSQKKCLNVLVQKSVFR